MWLAVAVSASAARQRKLQVIKQLRYASTKRFWKTVLAQPAEGGWQVTLDGRPIKTPKKELIVLPTYPLALAIAAEWEWLESGKPQPHLMPLMGLAATAIDQPQPRARVIEHVSKYLHTDSACCRYEPGELADRQASVFDPILARLQQQLGWQLSTSEDITGAPQSRETTAAVQAWLQGLDSWNLAAVDQLTTTSKSLVLAAALAHHMLSAEEALAAARLEERYQVEQWGSVEAGHDLDELETRTRIVAPTLLMNLLRVGGRGGTIDEQQ